MNDRVKVVDAIRGASLFGILLANMLIFQYGLYGKDDMSVYTLSEVDEVVHQLLKVFVETSFIPIFTFLFGYSMVKMRNSLERRYLKPTRHFVRRFMLLLIIGILHGTLLWEGDILMIYGMTGFLLLFFVKRKAKTLMIWAVTLWGITGLLGFGSNEWATTTEEKVAMETYLQETIEVYGSGSFVDIMSHRINEDPLLLDAPGIVILLLLAPLIMLPMFLLGMAAAKREWFQQIDHERWKTQSIFLIATGISLKSLMVLFPNFNGSGIGYALGGPLLALGYMFAFAVYFSSSRSIVVKGIESIGRLSLTNYLVQTMICVSLFYGYGFGWFGDVGVLVGVGIAILIYTTQWGVSLIYLSKWSTGPFEKLLRIGTYLSWSGKAKVTVPQPSSQTDHHSA